MASRNSTEGLRHYNRAVVLNALRDMGAGSHTDIAEHSGLASGTVSVITAELMLEGALKKIEQAPASGRGRPRVKFTMRPDFALLAIVRISSGEVEYSLINYAGTLVDRFATARPSEDESAEVFVARFREDITRMVDRSGSDAARIAAISITTKGLVAEDHATLLWSPVFGKTQIDFDAVLSPEWTGRVTLSHETEFSAYGCLARNADEPAHLVLSLGDSIGLGIAQRDATGIATLAPSFGHMTHTLDGPVCRCGDRGCVEAHAGFYAILRLAYDAPVDRIPANFIPLDQMMQLANQARSGDRKTEYAFRNAGEVLGLALSRLCSLYGPMPVTIAGPGVAFYDLLSDALRNPLEQNLRVRVSETPKFNVELSEPQLVFDSNASLSLRRFDKDLVATRSIEGKASA